MTQLCRCGHLLRAHVDEIGCLAMVSRSGNVSTYCGCPAFETQGATLAEDLALIRRAREMGEVIVSAKLGPIEVSR